MSKITRQDINDNHWIITEYDEQGEDIIKETNYQIINKKIVKHGIETINIPKKPKREIEWHKGIKILERFYDENDKLFETIDYSNKNQEIKTIYKKGKEDGVQLIINKKNNIKTAVIWKNGLVVNAYLAETKT